jgi:hypothetical protein
VSTHSKHTRSSPSYAHGGRTYLGTLNGQATPPVWRCPGKLVPLQTHLVPKGTHTHTPTCKPGAHAHDVRAPRGPLSCRLPFTTAAKAAPTPLILNSRPLIPSARTAATTGGVDVGYLTKRPANEQCTAGRATTSRRLSISVTSAKATTVTGAQLRAGAAAATLCNTAPRSNEGPNNMAVLLARAPGPNKRRQALRPPPLDDLPTKGSATPQQHANLRPVATPPAPAP